MSLTEKQEAERVAEQSKKQKEKEGTSKHGVKRKRTLDILMWNVRNLSWKLKGERGSTNDPYGVPLTILEYVKKNDVDIAILLELGRFIRIADYFGTTIWENYYILDTKGTGNEKYGIIIKKSILAKLLARRTELKLENFILDTKEVKLYGKINARKPGYLALRFGGFSIGISFLHAPSAKWKGIREKVIKNTIDEMDKVKPHLQFFCGDFNYKREELGTLVDVMEDRGFTFLGPGTSALESESTSLKKYFTIKRILMEDDEEESSIDEQIFNQPYDQVWVRSNALKDDYLECVSARRINDFSSLDTKIYSSMFNALRSITFSDFVRSIYSSKSGKRYTMENIFDDHVLWGSDTKRLIGDRAPDVASDEDISNLDALISNLLEEDTIQTIVIKLKAEDEIKNAFNFRYFRNFLIQVKKKLESPIDLYTCMALTSKMEALTLKLDSEELDIEDENSFWIAYEYLISDHLPISFTIDTDKLTDYVSEEEGFGTLSGKTRFHGEMLDGKEDTSSLEGKRQRVTISSSNEASSSSSDTTPATGQGSMEFEGGS